MLTPGYFFGKVRVGSYLGFGPRPLAVYMRSKADRDMVLANSYRLDRCQNEDWRAVNVVAEKK